MKRGLLFLSCLLAVSTLTGCSITGEMSKNQYWRDIGQFELVQTIAVDWTDPGVTVTVSSKATEDESGEKQEPLILSAEADTVVGALEQLHRFSSKEQIFFAHTRNYVLGEGAAENGVMDYLDFMERDLNMRLDTAMFIAKSGSAEILVEESASEEADISEILENFQRDTSLMSSGYVFSCQEVAKSLSECGSALVSAIELEESKEGAEGAREKQAVPAGYAVLKDGKLIDYLDADLSPGVNILLNKMESDVIEIPGDNGKFTAFRMTGGKSSFRPVFEDGRLAYIDVNIELRANINEISSEIDVFDESVLTRFQEEISERLGGVCEKVIARAQEQNADFLGIGKKIENTAPVAFAGMPATWTAVFPETDFRYHTNTVLERTYDLKEPLSVGGDHLEK